MALLVMSAREAELPLAFLLPSQSGLVEHWIGFSSLAGSFLVATLGANWVCRLPSAIRASTGLPSYCRALSASTSFSTVS